MSAQNTRRGWDQVPVGVRAAVERLLGAPVARAVSQPGGFSPGTADRVVTTAGTRAFVKAASAATNAVTIDLHRLEADALRRIPAAVRAPRVIGTVDEDGWFALVVEDVDGRCPATPWTARDIERVAADLRDLAAVPVDASAFPALAVEVAADFDGWERIVADPPAGLDPWARDRLDRLAGTAATAAGVLGGEALVHGDLRADNLLLEPGGGVRVVDWPNACVGSAWFDTLCLLVNVAVFGGHDVEALARRHLSAGPDEVDAVLASLAGYFLDRARRPPPPGLPTVRAFQAAQGAGTLRWLRRRWG